MSILNFQKLLKHWVLFILTWILACICNQRRTPCIWRVCTGGFLRVRPDFCYGISSNVVIEHALRRIKIKVSMTFGTFELSQLPPAHKGGLEELHLPPRHFNLGSPTFDNSPTYSQSCQLYQGEAVRTGDYPNPRVVVALAWHLPVLHYRWLARSFREKKCHKN